MAFVIRNLGLNQRRVPKLKSWHESSDSSGQETTGKILIGRRDTLQYLLAP